MPGLHLQQPGALGGLSNSSKEETLRRGCLGASRSALKEGIFLLIGVIAVGKGSGGI